MITVFTCVLSPRELLCVGTVSLNQLVTGMIWDATQRKIGSDNMKF